MGKSHGKVRGFFKFILELAIIIVVAVVLAWVLRTFVIEPYKIPSGSMETTIMTNDFVLAEKVSSRFDDPEQGDVVTFLNPMLSEEEAETAPDKVLIKRVIAVGGQTINLIGGRVFVDGVLVEEPYTTGVTSPLMPMEDTYISYPYTVPEGYVWVMGDNREHSSDSRFFGPVETSRILGRAVFIYWPISHAGRLGPEDGQDEG